MFLSVLSRNLNWESLTKNLVTFNFSMGIHWKIWFFRGCSLSHILEDSACYDFTKSADSQATINFSENDCIIAEILQKRLSNEWHQTEDLRKQESIWKNSNWMETDANGQSTF